jgi:hypothetical protein
MFRCISTIALATALAGLLVAPLSAAEPAVSKRVMTEDDGMTVFVVEVRGADRAIYGMTLLDETGSVMDIVAPKGWAGISSGDRVVFSTVDKPVGAGETVAFRIVTTNKSASLRVTFRDAKSMIHSKQTI